MTLSLTTRLLCAADHAYAILKDGDAPDSPPTYDPRRSASVGYLVKAKACCSGVKDINALLVGETATEIVVAFRGTLPFMPFLESPNKEQIIRDWLSDLNQPLVKDAATPALPGRVHAGFLDALNTVWDELTALLKPLLEKSPTKPLCITGHSKGGALANLAAMRCKLHYPNRQILVTTFAGARPGDKAFADAYAKQIPHSTRFEYQDDIVPHLPPSNIFSDFFKLSPQLGGVIGDMKIGYESVGDLHFIDWDGKIQLFSVALKAERYLHLAGQLAGLGYIKIAHDHSIDPGYYKAVAALP